MKLAWNLKKIEAKLIKQSVKPTLLCRYSTEDEEERRAEKIERLARGFAQEVREHHPDRKETQTIVHFYS